MILGPKTTKSHDTIIEVSGTDGRLCITFKPKLIQSDVYLNSGRNEIAGT